MVDCEDNVGYVQRGKMSSPHSQPNITRRGPTYWREEGYETLILTLICNSIPPSFVAISIFPPDRLSNDHRNRNADIPYIHECLNNYVGYGVLLVYVDHSFLIDNGELSSGIACRKDKVPKRQLDERGRFPRKA